MFTVVILGVGALVSAATHLSLTQDRQVALGVTGLVGLIGMAFAVGFGVWISLRIGLGEMERRNSSFTWWVITRLAFLVGGTNLAGFFIYFLQERFPELAGQRAAGPAAIPPINTQRALTTLLVSDGQTSVIGGIYTSNQQNSTDRTPGLGQIPILNWLFKRERVDDQSTELLIFITPRIIKS